MYGAKGWQYPPMGDCDGQGMGEEHGLAVLMVEVSSSDDEDESLNDSSTSYASAGDEKRIVAIPSSAMV